MSCLNLFKNQRAGPPSSIPDVETIMSAFSALFLSDLLDIFFAHLHASSNSCGFLNDSGCSICSLAMCLPMPLTCTSISGRYLCNLITISCVLPLAKAGTRAVPPLSTTSTILSMNLLTSSSKFGWFLPPYVPSTNTVSTFLGSAPFVSG